MWVGSFPRRRYNPVQILVCMYCGGIMWYVVVFCILCVMVVILDGVRVLWYASLPLTSASGSWVVHLMRLSWCFVFSPFCSWYFKLFFMLLIVAPTPLIPAWLWYMQRLSPPPPLPLFLLLLRPLPLLKLKFRNATFRQELLYVKKNSASSSLTTHNKLYNAPFSLFFLTMDALRISPRLYLYSTDVTVDAKNYF